MLGIVTEIWSLTLSLTPSTMMGLGGAGQAYCPEWSPSLSLSKKVASPLLILAELNIPVR
jgi:hypothetical protein